ncbi:MAG TPA: FG-GAP repeat protein [Solirubrobacteraceae bacterium]
MGSIAFAVTVLMLAVSASASSGASAFVQQAKIQGDGGAFGGAESNSVALSSDGSTALVGAPEEEGDEGGSVWVLTLSGSSWTVQAKLKMPGTWGVAGGGFGESVALSADGNTALIGDGFQNGEYGTAWVFTRSGTSWSEQEELTATEIGDEEQGRGRFGASVALSADGDIALIGGPRDQPETQQGAAWIYARSGSRWIKQGPMLKGGGELSAPGSSATEAGFGWSVALSSSGDTALVGAWRDHDATGAAWVFTRSGSSWIQQGARLSADDEVGQGEFGTRVALSSEGNTALIGGSTDNDGVGAAWVFTRSGETWTQQGAKLTPSDEIGRGYGQFGWSVALDSDGDTALIGGSADGADETGAAWVFTRAGSTWTQQQKLTGEGELGGARFGRSVALSSSGATALIGGPEDDVKLGAAWVFTNPEPYVPLETVSSGQSATTGAGGMAGGMVIAPIVADGTGPAGGTVTAPIITDLSQSDRDWRAGNAFAKLARNQTLAPVGTSFSFTLNEAASVKLAFTKHVRGREINGMCDIEPRGRQGRICTRTITKGALTLSGRAGKNKLVFQGRVTASDKLGPGSYTVAITATSSAGHSATHSLDFTIVTH